MPTIAIVYHSGFGHTKVIAASVARGAAAVDGVDARLISVDELPPPGPDRSLAGRWPELDRADAIILGSPTYMGTVSAEFKRFMESSGSIWLAQGWKDKLAAGFTNAGGLSGDKVNALIDMVMFAAQHSMIWVSQGLFYDDTGINRMGSWIGMQSQSTDDPPEVTPPPEDHRTAELFGERVALAAVRWARGGAV
ncbi:MAG: flavodoxin family protein [Phycisphaeraceae bacterium]|nr:MAG: flavodoxin family protein [Phycisphaeraceae bacterium]